MNDLQIEFKAEYKISIDTPIREYAKFLEDKIFIMGHKLTTLEKEIKTTRELINDWGKE